MLEPELREVASHLLRVGAAQVLKSATTPAAVKQSRRQKCVVLASCADPCEVLAVPVTQLVDPGLVWMGAGKGQHALHNFHTSGLWYEHVHVKAHPDTL